MQLSILRNGMWLSVVLVGIFSGWAKGDTSVTRVDRGYVIEMDGQPVVNFNIPVLDGALDFRGRLLDLGHPTVEFVHEPLAFGYLFFGQLVRNQLTGIRISAAGVFYYTMQQIGLFGSGVYLA